MKKKKNLVKKIRVQSFFFRVNNGVTKVQKYLTTGNTVNAARPRAGGDYCGLPTQVTIGVLPRTSVSG